MFEDICVVVGRVLIGGAFLWMAVDKVLNWNQNLIHLHKKKVPNPDLALKLFVGLQALGSLSIITGFFMFIGAPLLLLTKLAAMFKFNHFWTQSGAERDIEKKRFIKDVVMIGSLIILFGIGLGY